MLRGACLGRTSSLRVVCCCVSVLLLLATSHARIQKRQSLSKQSVDEEALSDEPHVKNGEHNVDFDHQAFLGRDEAKHFNELPEAEAKLQLNLIFDKIDSDGNGGVAEDELTDWIRRVHLHERMDVVHAHWKQYGLADDEQLSIAVAGLSHYSGEPDPGLDEGAKQVFLRSQASLRRKWAAADLNKDEKLSKEEFVAFLHPSDWEHMQPVIIEDILEEVDLDKDDYVSKEEFMHYAYPNGNTDPAAEEPLSIREERERFEQIYDVNSDGRLDEQETRRWVLPSLGQERSEAQHLVTHADLNKDGKLSRGEMIDNWQLFVGSKVTGSMRANLHEEL